MHTVANRWHVVVVQGVGYPGLSGSMATVDGRLVGPCCARLPSRDEFARADKLAKVCEGVTSKVDWRTMERILADDTLLTLPRDWREDLTKMCAGKKEETHNRQPGEASVGGGFEPTVSNRALRVRSRQSSHEARKNA